MKLSSLELFEFLEFYHDKYNRVDFIENDPISIPHNFSKKEDIEISGFLSATIAWGKREMIIKNAKQLMQLMDNSPFDFIINHKKKDISVFENFKHRTFNYIDISYFIKALANIYKHHNGLENVFSIYENENSTYHALNRFNNVFFELINQPQRTKKHVSNPQKGSAAKRLNMFLRWMIRKDNRGVDFGIWNIPSSKLICPLDVHTGNISRKLGLLNKPQNDWKSAEILTKELIKFDAVDPVKYDFALFGVGIHEEI